MKLVLSILLALFATTLVGAQVEVMLHISPRMGDATFALNTATDHPGGGYQLKFTRFDYYISEVKITHDGGQVTPATDMHLLVHAGADSMFTLGSMDVTNIENITFSVGVEQSFNHTDPSIYPSNNPLSPQNPEMQWGWTAGYRFAAIGGDAGSNFGQNFQVHALGDANYKTVSLAAGEVSTGSSTLTIHIDADYAQALTSINVSNGLIIHGATGASATLMVNMGANVFSTMAPSSVINPAFGGSFSVSPNPVVSAVPTARFTLPLGSDYRLSVSDMAGKTLLNESLSADSQSFILGELPSSGIFLVQLWQNGLPVATEKLVVIE